MKSKFSFTPIFRPKKTRRPSSSSEEPSYFSFSSSYSLSSSSDDQETPKSIIPSYNPPSLSFKSQFSNSGISEDDVIEIFKLLDRDGDGRISLHELELLFRRLGNEHPPGRDEMELILSEGDLDGDGSISLEEFRALSSALGPAEPPELLDAFGFFDEDGDGRICAEELLGGFLALGDERCTLDDCRRMIQGVDAEGKGFICFEDFARMMTING